MKGKAKTHGAVSIVNAIALWRGAALGIDLEAEAEVALQKGSGRIEVLGVQGDAYKKLPTLTVREVFTAKGRSDLDAQVVVRSQIPPARGLKSSSAVSNAVAAATLAALGDSGAPLEAIQLAVEASLKAGVTITGAFDDAAASSFGGFVVADNKARRILRQEKAPSDLVVALYIPEAELPKGQVGVERITLLAPLVEEAFSLCLQGEYWKAMTFNGLLHAAALGFPGQPIVDALEAGALAAGLSGTGPAMAAICRRDQAKGVQAAWSALEGTTKLVDVNNEEGWVQGG